MYNLWKQPRGRVSLFLVGGHPVSPDRPCLSRSPVRWAGGLAFFFLFNLLLYHHFMSLCSFSLNPPRLCCTVRPKPSKGREEENEGPWHKLLLWLRACSHYNSRTAALSGGAGGTVRCHDAHQAPEHDGLVSGYSQLAQYNTLLLPRLLLTCMMISIYPQLRFRWWLNGDHFLQVVNLGEL